MAKTKQKGGVLSGPSHKYGGIAAVVGGKEPVELEGGEYIIRKSSVDRLGKKTLDEINQKGRIPTMANGGVASDSLRKAWEVLPDSTKSRRYGGDYSAFKAAVETKQANMAGYGKFKDTNISEKQQKQLERIKKMKASRYGSTGAKSRKIATREVPIYPKADPKDPGRVIWHTEKKAMSDSEYKSAIGKAKEKGYGGEYGSATTSKSAPVTKKVTPKKVLTKEQQLASISSAGKAGQRATSQKPSPENLKKEAARATKDTKKTLGKKEVAKKETRFVEGVGETDLTDEQLREFGMLPESKKDKTVKKKKVSGKDLQQKAGPKPDEEVKPSKLSPTTVSDMRAKQKELLAGLKKTKSSKMLSSAKKYAKSPEKRDKDFRAKVEAEKAKRMKEAKKSKLRKGIDSLKKMLSKKKEDKLKKSGVGLHLKDGGYLPTSSIPAPPPFRQGMRMMGHGGQVSVSNDKAGAGDIHTTHSHSGYKAGE